MHILILIPMSKRLFLSHFRSEQALITSTQDAPDVPDASDQNCEQMQTHVPKASLPCTEASHLQLNRTFRECLQIRDQQREKVSSLQQELNICIMVRDELRRHMTFTEQQLGESKHIQHEQFRNLQRQKMSLGLRCYALCAMSILLVLFMAFSIYVSVTHI
jgi:hypothetical protein